MKIVSIKNKKTGSEVCRYYCKKDLNMYKCIIKKGKPLVIVYEDSSFFVHEDVLFIGKINNDKLVFETTKKIWVLGN